MPTPYFGFISGMTLLHPGPFEEEGATFSGKDLVYDGYFSNYQYECSPFRASISVQV